MLNIIQIDKNVKNKKLNKNTKCNKNQTGNLECGQIEHYVKNFLGTRFKSC